MLTPHLYTLPLFVYVAEASWDVRGGILRFFDIQAISHQEALEVLSFLKPDFSFVPCACLCHSCLTPFHYPTLYLCLIFSPT